MSRVFAELLLQQKKHCALAVKDARQQRDVEEWRHGLGAAGPAGMRDLLRRLPVPSVFRVREIYNTTTVCFVWVTVWLTSANRSAVASWSASSRRSCVRSAPSLRTGLHR